MTADQTWLEYEERFDVVFSHIYEHLDEPLDLIRLAEVAGLSPRHWHRIFTSAFGESVPALVKRVGLQRAVSLLVSGSTPIRDVAIACGYSDLSSFARAFRMGTGTTPAHHRDYGGHIDLGLARVRRDPAASDVQVTARPSVDCIAACHRGSYLEIDRTFQYLRIWLAAKGYGLQNQEMCGVFVSDPTQTAEAELESMACVTRPPGLTSDIVPLSPDAPAVEPHTIRTGTYAALSLVGADADMPDKYAWHFGCWVPHSGQILSDAPVVERYITNPRDGIPTRTTTEFFAPPSPHTFDDLYSSTARNMPYVVRCHSKPSRSIRTTWCSRGVMIGSWRHTHGFDTGDPLVEGSGEGEELKCVVTGAEATRRRWRYCAIVSRATVAACRLQA